MQKRGHAKTRRLPPSLCRSALLLPYSEINSLQNVSSLVLDLNMPRALRVRGNILAAPRAPRRSADRQWDVADLIAAMEPDVMQRLSVGSRHAHPQHHRPHAVGERGAGILRRAVRHVARQDSLDTHVAG